MLYNIKLWGSLEHPFRFGTYSKKADDPGSKKGALIGALVKVRVAPSYKILNKTRLKMAVVQKLGSVKRFGPRYGRSIKYKLAKIEAIQKGKHQCPYCHNLKAKRLSVGIWNCRKCGAKFTGKAYSVKKIVTEEIEEETEKKEVKETKEEETEKEE